ncbi:hypothetical protein M422DRAFT_23283 [Sphaerobolus stellatus SS14]|nr:hypothetical protein M422DRAFT_23283 [Sphaerobolus stellatus SS14]
MLIPLTVNWLLGSLLCVLGLHFLIRRRMPQGVRLPPGPPGKWLVGNMADMPKEHEWETYTKWAKEYGEIVYIKVLQKPIVFVNSMSVAKDLFERRSRIYSDRFDAPMIVDLMGFHWNFVVMRYGDKWRRHRRTFHQYFNQHAIKAFQPVQTQCSRELLRRLREEPEEFLDHCRNLVGALAMKILYGIKVQPKNDPYIKLAEDAFDAGSQAANPGTFLVDTFPILKYVPEWMPGAGFKKKARIWRTEIITKVPIIPFIACKEEWNAGKASPSFTASSLERITHNSELKFEEEEIIIRNTAATAYGAAADTTTVALQWFFLEMALYPEVQIKAQSELDRILGDRLPTYEDQEYLPYINALCKEIQRYHTVFPLGIAHGLMEDDIYNGYFIPKGSIVIGNSWAMLHDPDIYGPNVNKFDPDRFLRPGVPDPIAAFGHGRRICPGRHLAENTIFLAVASVLKVFNISPPKGDDGREIPIDVKFTSGAISRPLPYRCSITARSQETDNLVNFALE